MLEQHVHREIFLIPKLRSEAQLSKREVPQILCVGAAWSPVAHPVTDPLLKVIVFNRLVPNIRRGHNMHEYIVANFDEVAEPHHRLRHLLGTGE